MADWQLRLCGEEVCELVTRQLCVDRRSAVIYEESEDE